MRVRPRRAMPAPIAVRVARVAGPAVAAGALITTVAVTAWPSSTGSLQAVPIDSSASVLPSMVAAPSSSAADAARATRADRGTRSETRPSLTASDEKAEMVESAKEQAAEDEAAEAKAAKKKAAAREAAES